MLEYILYATKFILKQCKTPETEKKIPQSVIY